MHTFGYMKLALLWLMYSLLLGLHTFLMLIKQYQSKVCVAAEDHERHIFISLLSRDILNQKCGC